MNILWGNKENPRRLFKGSLRGWNYEIIRHYPRFCVNRGQLCMFLNVYLSIFVSSLVSGVVQPSTPLTSHAIGVASLVNDKV